MDNIYFKTKGELDDFLRKHTVKRLGVGREGQCSLLDNGVVAKTLWQDYYPSFALQFKDVEAPSFVFARSAAFVSDYVRAIFMEYAQGKELSKERIDYQRFDILGDQLGVLTKDITTISEMGILIKDFHCGNTVYDGNKFKVIDTLPYLRLPKGNYKVENLREVMIRMYDYLLADILKYKKVSGKYGFYGHIEFLEDPKYYFEVLREYLASLTETEITTIEEANMALKKKFKE